MTKRCYFTFPSIYFAIRAEKLLKGSTFTFKMVPVPRRISSSCGTSLRCLPEEARDIQGVLEEGSVSVEGYYEFEEQDDKGFPFLKKRN